MAPTAGAVINLMALMMLEVAGGCDGYGGSGTNTAGKYGYHKTSYSRGLNLQPFVS